MKFDELDAMMRAYETASDRHVEAGVYMVARIDGRSFTKLTKESYWMLRKEGAAKGAAAAQIEGRSIEDKVALLAGRGIDFHALPAWQLRGAGFYWVDQEKRGYNPKQQVEVVSSKRAIKTDFDLPVGEAYADFVRAMLSA